nr:hypothetical protein [Tanacetum cinerariifolium]
MTNTPPEINRNLKFKNLNGNHNNGNGNGNSGNGNGNGNGRNENGNGHDGNRNGDGRGDMHVARECTYQNFMKCQPLNFKGTEGVVGLIRWCEKIETMFHINNCPERYLRAYETDDRSVLFEKRDSKDGNQVMEFVGKKQWHGYLHLEVPRTYHDMYQNGPRVEKFIRGLPDNIQGNVIAIEPTRLKDVVRIANNLIDKKLKGYAVKTAKNKRRFDTNHRDNHGQQPPFN